MSAKVKILNLDIDNVSLTEMLHNLKKGIVITPNVDHLMKVQKDYEFYRIYQLADYIICDSQILFYAAQLLGTPLKEKLCGSDFFPALCNYHKDNPDFRVFLLGGNERSVKIAEHNLNQKAEREIVAGVYSPPFGFEKNELECQKIADIVNQSGANVLAVGVGAPKQEKWIYKNKYRMPGVDIYLGIGATIEFEAGTLDRAPLWMRESGFEWLYRLLKEPKRLWKRYLVESLPFFGLLYQQKLNLYQNPFGAIDENRKRIKTYTEPLFEPEPEIHSISQ